MTFMDFLTVNTFFGALFGFLTIHTLVSGTAYIPGRPRPFRRAETPVNYWLATLFPALLFAVALMFVAADLKRGTHPTVLPARNDAVLLGLATAFRVEPGIEVVMHQPDHWHVQNDAGQVLGDGLTWVDPEISSETMTRSEAFALLDRWEEKTRSNATPQ